ncbi:MAG: hypothetical protein R3F13_11150 [Prosthecobacter sp.]
MFFKATKLEGALREGQDAGLVGRDGQLAAAEADENADGALFEFGALVVEANVVFKHRLRDFEILGLAALGDFPCGAEIRVGKDGGFLLRRRRDGLGAAFLEGRDDLLFGIAFELQVSSEKDLRVVPGPVLTAVRRGCPPWSHLQERR